MSNKILVTSKVIEALGKIGDTKARDVLLESLKSQEFFIRASGAQALGRIKDKESIPLLKELLNDENYLVRVFSAVALVDLGQKGIERFIFNYLKDKNPAIRAATVEEAGRLGERRFFFTFNKMLINEKDDSVRVKLIEKLGENRFNPALENIQDVLEDKNADVRRVACRALGNIGYKKSLPLLLERLGDENATVRSTAKEILAQMGESRLVKFFWSDIDEKDEFLRTGSYLALAYLKDFKILPILLKAIVAPDNSTFVRKEAARALAVLKYYLSEKIDEALLNPDVKYGKLLSENLRAHPMVNGRDLVFTLTQALRNNKDPLYYDAPLILRELAVESGLPSLRDALMQDDPDLVATTAFVLGELKDNNAVDYLIKVFKDYGI